MCFFLGALGVIRGRGGRCHRSRAPRVASSTSGLQTCRDRAAPDPVSGLHPDISHILVLTLKWILEYSDAARLSCPSAIDIAPLPKPPKLYLPPNFLPAHLSCAPSRPRIQPLWAEADACTRRTRHVELLHAHTQLLCATSTSGLLSLHASQKATAVTQSTTIKD